MVSNILTIMIHFVYTFALCIYTCTDHPDQYGVSQLSCLSALHSGLARVSCRLWFVWNSGIEDLLVSTARYEASSGEIDGPLLQEWKSLVRNCSMAWTKLVGCPPHITATIDPDDSGDSESEDEGRVYEDDDNDGNY